MCAPRWCWPAATSSKSLSQSRCDTRRPECGGLCYSAGKRDNSLAFDISVWARIRLNLMKFLNRSNSVRVLDSWLVFLIVSPSPAQRLRSCPRTSMSQYIWCSDCVWWLNRGDRLLTGPVPERSMPTGEICENMPPVISSPFPWQLHSVRKLYMWAHDR